MAVKYRDIKVGNLVQWKEDNDIGMIYRIDKHKVFILWAMGSTGKWNKECMNQADDMILYFECS